MRCSPWAYSPSMTRMTRRRGLHRATHHRGRRGSGGFSQRGGRRIRRRHCAARERADVSPSWNRHRNATRTLACLQHVVEPQDAHVRAPGFAFLGPAAAADPHLRALSQPEIHQHGAAFGWPAKRAGRRGACVCRSGMRGSNNVVIAHEILHTLGASDKYDPATRAPLFPIGYAEPEREPRFPQEFAEIMAGRYAMTRTPSKCPSRWTKSSSERPPRWRSAGWGIERIPARNRAIERGGAGARARRPLDCTIRAGEFLALLGGNGAGKSLLLRTLAGLRAPAAGRYGSTAATCSRWRVATCAATRISAPGSRGRAPGIGA